MTSNCLSQTQPVTLFQALESPKMKIQLYRRYLLVSLHKMEAGWSLDDGRVQEGRDF